MDNKILHLWCFHEHPAPDAIADIANRLELDKDEVLEIIKDLQMNFSLDNLVKRVANAHQHIQEEKYYCRNCEKQVLHGFDVSKIPKDTAEYRKMKRKNKLHYSPYPE